MNALLFKIGLNLSKTNSFGFFSKKREIWSFGNVNRFGVGVISFLTKISFYRKIKGWIR